MEEKNTPLVEVRNLKKYFKTKNGILHGKHPPYNSSL